MPLCVPAAPRLWVPFPCLNPRRSQFVGRPAVTGRTLTAPTDSLLPKLLSVGSLVAELAERMLAAKWASDGKVDAESRRR